MAAINIEQKLVEHGVKPTSNRIIVLRALIEALRPLSLGELDEVIETLDKSSILRALTLFLDHHIVHSVEDGRGVLNYELCHSDSDDGDDDMHVHFYCTRCRKIYCFEEIPAPVVELPDGFTTTSVNYMLKGICPSCGANDSPSGLSD